MTIESTYHSQQRGKQRLNKTQKQFEGLLPKVLLKGKTIEDYKNFPRMQKYLKGVLKAGQEGNFLRVFGNEIFIFALGNICLTVLTIPQKILQNNFRR